LRWRSSRQESWPSFYIDDGGIDKDWWPSSESGERQQLSGKLFEAVQRRIAHKEEPQELANKAGQGTGGSTGCDFEKGAH